MFPVSFVVNNMRKLLLVTPFPHFCRAKDIVAHTAHRHEACAEPCLRTQCKRR